MINVLIDGATSKQSQKSGAGIVIKANGNVFEYAIPLGNITNHEAEFLALFKALQICARDFPEQIIAVQSDSQLVVQAIEKKYVKNELYQSIFNEIIKLADTFPYFFIKWIPNEQNKHADRLAKQAIAKTK